MKIYQPRPIRFMELFMQDEMTLKVYSISDKQEFVSSVYIERAKKQSLTWLRKRKLTSLESYRIATLILHECKEGCFAIINWWIDDNMLQHYVYLAENEMRDFKEYSSENGINTCVWELEVLWFERNAWIKNVLTRRSPDFGKYLLEQLNKD